MSVRPIAPFPRCDQTVAWAALKGHWEAHGRTLDLRTLFENDPDRVQRLSVQAPCVHADFSRALADVATVRHLLDMARECGIEQQRDALLSGAPVNQSEGRAALHTALRAPRGQGPHSELVHGTLDRVLAFAEDVRARAGGGAAGDIHDVVNIGIGGSDLGPQMVIPALDPYGHEGLRFHFVSNVDGHNLTSVLRGLKPEHTLFVLASKTFTTQETIANAHAARQWFLDQGGTDLARHFVATTTNVEAATAFGIQTTFDFWDWVGGRFSLWSAIGLPVAIALGREQFQAFLGGAHAMDEHFAQAPLHANAPVCLGLLDVWYRNFRGYASRCVAPYHDGLRRLPAYLQQLVMESNGKAVDMRGETLPYGTADVLWGEPGCNGQHAFFQMLHQGTDVIPVEFVLVRKALHRDEARWSPAFRELMDQQHQLLLTNGLAQAQALMWGRSTEQAALDEVPTANPAMSSKALARQRTFPGNRPSLTLLLEELSPASLGALLALYEHRTFVSGALWGINSFDQWGVELGKALTQGLLPRLASGQVEGLDAATANLIRRLR